MRGGWVQAAVPSDGYRAGVLSAVVMADCWQWCRGSAVEGLGWRGGWCWSCRLGSEPEAASSSERTAVGGCRAAVDRDAAVPGMMVLLAADGGPIHGESAGMGLGSLNDQVVVQVVCWLLPVLGWNSTAGVESR